MNPDSYTVFSASEVYSSNKHKAVYSNRDVFTGNNRGGFILYAKPNSNIWSHWTGINNNKWDQLNATSTTNNWSGQQIHFNTTASNLKKIYVNNDLKAQKNKSYNKNVDKPFRVGAGDNTNSTPKYYFKGEIGEIIMYDTPLKKTERIIVANYLSAKYGYTLTKEDLYIQDNAANGNYDHDVAGVGKINTNDQHTDSQGTGRVRISNPSNLNDNEFLFWGHDNGVPEAVETTDIPSSVEARLDRVWRVNEVDINGEGTDVGDINIRFDLTNMGPVIASDLRLLIDENNNGNFNDETPINGAVALGNNIYEFSNISKIANSLRFTLGTINVAQTPLPIELVYFDAHLLENGTVNLSWQTASERNNDFFTVEKSKNGEKWEELAIIIGAGNSNQNRNYATIDFSPLKDVSYYRLKQTDFDGVFSFSKKKRKHQ